MLPDARRTQVAVTSFVALFAIVGLALYGLPLDDLVSEGLLGLVERVLKLFALVVAQRGDLAAGIDQLTQQRGALDDSRVVLDVVRGRHGIDHVAQVRHAADLRLP